LKYIGEIQGLASGVVLFIKSEVLDQAKAVEKAHNIVSVFKNSCSLHSVIRSLHHFCTI